MAKKEENSKKDLAEQYFIANASEKKVHVTSDNYLFQQLKHALDHANTLGDSEKEIETFTNPVFIEVESEEVKG